LAIDWISSKLASGFPYYKLYKTESLKRMPFYGIIDMYFLKLSNFKSLKSCPSIKIFPSIGSYILNKRLKSVVLPKPLYPTIAFVVPG